MGPDWSELAPRLKALGLSPDDLSHPGVAREVRTGRRVIIAESDPRHYLSAFFVSLRESSAVFLGNPKWGADRWREAVKTIEPHVIIGEPLVPVDSHLDGPADRRRNWPAIMIPTSGTSGGMRFAINTWVKLAAAAKAFQQRFGGGPVNNVCVLPVWHVSGLMQAVRSLVSGGDLLIHEYSRIEDGEFPDLRDDSYMLSLVPTQLRRLLANPDACQWLSRMRAVLLGGAPASVQLLADCREAGLNIAPCYGLTESAALVTVLDPDEFLNGADGVGKALPGADVFIRSEFGMPVEPMQHGRVILNSDALFHGYYPNVSRSLSDGFATDDEGYLDLDGNLHVVGRFDRTIITGGENVDPISVENAIVNTGLVSDVVVYGRSDPDWGRAVSAAVVSSGQDTSLNGEALKIAVAPTLSSHEIPKHWVILDRMPRDELGKIDIRDKLFNKA